MKKMLSSLAADRQSASAISTRLQTTLHVLADTQVFVLHASPDCDTLLVVGLGCFANIPEVEVEDDPAMIDINRQHEVRIHVPLVAVDHQVGILPEIPGAI